MLVGADAVQYGGIFIEIKINIQVLENKKRVGGEGRR